LPVLPIVVICTAALRNDASGHETSLLSLSDSMGQ
jgi:hypothetical protein